MKAVLFLFGLSVLIIKGNTGKVSTADYQQTPVEVDPAEAVELGKYPWHAFIYGTEEYLGSGSIINPSWVLTSAKLCTSRSQLMLQLGTIQQFDVNSVKSGSSDLRIHSDICLIKLVEPLEFTQNIKPIKLLSSEQLDKTFVDYAAHIAGVTALNRRHITRPRKMSWGELKIVPQDKCSNYFSSLNENSLCVEGDSKMPYGLFCRTEMGTPLMVKDANNEWMQIGFKMTPAHDRCAEDSYSLYQSLSPYLEFIHKTIEEEN